jgi:pyruvate dehydrogenase E2 component (dihydrolipoamide acetyltransferase)
LAFQVILPKLTYEMEEGHILEWLCQEGDEVAVGQPLFVVETDKAAVEVPAEIAGTLLQVLVHAGETVPVSAPLAWIGAPGEAIAESGVRAPSEMAAPVDVAATAIPTQQTPAAPRRTGEIAASPIAKRLARELGVDLADVQEYVGQKRLREADVRAFADAWVTATRPAPAPDGEAEFDLLELTPVWRTMASHLSQAAAIPQSAAACQVDLTNLKMLRTELLADWEAAYGWRLSYTHMLAALIARALGSCPTLNASWTDEGIRLYRTVNLGVAMASDRGLVVPVVRNAGQLSLAETAAEIVRLQRAVERNRLLPTDLQGGTFTLTNVGMLGITLSIPLLNPPQSGILGIGAEETKVVLEDNRLWSIPVAWITAVTDHRVVDGAAAAAFLQQAKALIENPSAVLR